MQIAFVGAREAEVPGFQEQPTGQPLIPPGQVSKA